MRGNCYVASEAIYHLIGGKLSGWKPMRLKHENGMHWFLKHTSGLIIDTTVSQFKTKPKYENAIGCGFLTKQPSKRAKDLMKKMVWQDV